MRRVWTYLAESPLLESKQILGVAQPIPDSGVSSPLLDRDGARLLHPDLVTLLLLL